MGYSLRQVYQTINDLPIVDGDKDGALSKLEDAIGNIKESAELLDTFQVVTRGCVDALLGCMMAIDAIIGDENHG